jgi:hypothetical protein
VTAIQHCVGYPEPPPVTIKKLPRTVLPTQHYFPICWLWFTNNFINQLLDDNISYFKTAILKKHNPAYTNVVVITLCFVSTGYSHACLISQTIWLSELPRSKLVRIIDALPYRRVKAQCQLHAAPALTFCRTVLYVRQHSHSSQHDYFPKYQRM